MGIYISGVKGLPEQVQENKENIKDIQEEIEGIDFDAIHNLENQVAENTQDINNMEGTIGTQNIAITNLGGRVDDLEDKTQDISRQGSTLYIDTGEVVLNADLTFEADSGSDIKLNNEADSPNKIVSAQDPNNFIDFDSSNCVHIMSDGGEYEFSGDQILVNGTPIGGGGHLHNIRITTGYYYASFCFIKIFDSSDTAFTISTLATYLYNNGFIDVATMYDATGVFGNNTNNFISGVYSADGTTIKAVYGHDNSWSDALISNFTLRDIVQ